MGCARSARQLGGGLHSGLVWGHLCDGRGELGVGGGLQCCDVLEAGSRAGKPGGGGPCELGLHSPGSACIRGIGRLLALR